jgi:hypothetical protein
VLVLGTLMAEEVQEVPVAAAEVVGSEGVVDLG